VVVGGNVGRKIAIEERKDHSGGDWRGKRGAEMMLSVSPRSALRSEFLLHSAPSACSLLFSALHASLRAALLVLSKLKRNRAIRVRRLCGAD
jgi:ABC-type cobalamin transport system ATPase subunit